MRSRREINSFACCGGRQNAGRGDVRQGQTRKGMSGLGRTCTDAVHRQARKDGVHGGRVGLDCPLRRHFTPHGSAVQTAYHLSRQDNTGQLSHSGREAVEGPSSLSADDRKIERTHCCNTVYVKATSKWQRHQDSAAARHACPLHLPAGTTFDCLTSAGGRLSIAHDPSRDLGHEPVFVILGHERSSGFGDKDSPQRSRGGARCWEAVLPTACAVYLAWPIASCRDGRGSARLHSNFFNRGPD